MKRDLQTFSLKKHKLLLFLFIECLNTWTIHTDEGVATMWKNKTTINVASGMSCSYNFNYFAYFIVEIGSTNEFEHLYQIQIKKFHQIPYLFIGWFQDSMENYLK